MAKDVVMHETPNPEAEERVTKRKLAAEDEAAKEDGDNNAASHEEDSNTHSSKMPLTAPSTAVQMSR